RWLALGAVAVAELLAMTTGFSTAAVVPQLRIAWDLSQPAASWLTVAVQLGFVVGAVLSASINLADLVSPRWLMFFGASGAAVTNLLLTQVHGVEPAIALRLATGAALALVYPPALKLMATWFRSGRGVALGVLVAALTLGSATPHLVNGIGGVQWQVVIVSTSVLTLTGGVLALVAGVEGPFAFPSARFEPRQVGRAFADRGVRLASLGYFGHMWELYAMWAWFGVFLVDVFARRGTEDTRVAASYATFVVIGSGALGSIVGGVLGDRWGRTKLTALAMTCSGATALVIGGFVNGPLWLVLGLGVFWGFWVIADSAQFSAIVTETGNQRYVGTALTLQLAAGFVLTAVTIYLVPLVRDAEGWWLAFAILAPGPILGVAAMMRLANSPEAKLIAGGKG
ncbi:MAG TPA: MFS transporter, partial [Actinomycetes bacterium]|nr:MFS transporter [Actinomycetes bacterium]